MNEKMYTKITYINVYRIKVSIINYY
jgi:hypothetical protein